MSRLDTIKRVGFPVEECPKCHADEEDCSLCNGTGKFKQVVSPNWSPPVLHPGESMVAYLDVDYWSGIAVIDAKGEVVSELDFPFATDFATSQHFEALGFEVEQ
jgi:hypothetical protein